MKVAKNNNLGQFGVFIDKYLYEEFSEPKSTFCWK